MNNEKYNQIIDDAYKNYCLKKGSKIGEYGCRPILLTKEEFINKIKTDDEFSEKWGLKIEERELSLEERKKLVGDKTLLLLGSEEDSFDEAKIPRKQITITYDNETIEIYE